MTSVRFNVTGMSCAHCKAAVEKELNKVDGVERSSADIENDVVVVAYDESRVAPEQLARAIEAAGYDVA